MGIKLYPDGSIEFDSVEQLKAYNEKKISPQAAVAAVTGAVVADTIGKAFSEALHNGKHGKRRYYDWKVLTEKLAGELSRRRMTLKQIKYFCGIKKDNNGSANRLIQKMAKQYNIKTFGIRNKVYFIEKEGFKQANHKVSSHYYDRDAIFPKIKELLSQNPDRSFYWAFKKITGKDGQGYMKKIYGSWLKSPQPKVVVLQKQTEFPVIESVNPTLRPVAKNMLERLIIDNSLKMFKAQEGVLLEVSDKWDVFCFEVMKHSADIANHFRAKGKFRIENGAIRFVANA